ncbi:hypothetical protein Back2_17110 [Nocardioides baekrokdamisoli]|uniref:Uncharacterized protein n=1 Tax=Nocardioides baekrokdamisoli TaxID=1804624 RepID=A0A3G9J1U2_9ACTN|nr:hypothetical protein Back2_17110 [Nocardioides baekrokdamisoli]
MQSGAQVVRAKYAFRGMAASLGATIPLAPNTRITLSGIARWHVQGMPRTAYVRLSDDRLSVLLHFAFRPDQVIDMPRTAIRSVRWSGGITEIDYQMSSGAEELLRLGDWRGRFGAPSQPIECRALASALGWDAS